MESDDKPRCEFGARCYRKNPKHFESYSHAEELVTGHVDRKEKTEERDENPRKKMRQTILRFPKKSDFQAPLSNASDVDLTEKAVTADTSAPSARGKRKCERSILPKKNKKALRGTRGEKKLGSTSIKTKTNCFKSQDAGCGSMDSSDDTLDCDTVQSTSWIFVKKPVDETEHRKNLQSLDRKTPEETIRALFLVNMPPDFYSFFDFCKTINRNNPVMALELCQINLVGPFDVLSGKVHCPNSDQDLGLCHWRFYYDPPEFQTILVSESGFHIGYWRDEPKEDPVFLASNSPDKNCVFTIEAENIFGTTYHYLNEYIKSCDPFKKVRIAKLQNALSEWAVENNFSLEKRTCRIKERQCRVVSKTFHKVGIVVPVEAKTELGYRPLIETEATLKRICKLIMESDENERESLWENLQPLINAANIANDECDFGNSLELGMDLFCMGSELFHNTVEHLLSTAYSLLNRSEFERIIKAHLKLRRKGNSLSVFG